MSPIRCAGSSNGNCRGGLTMDWTTLLALLMAVGLLIYLSVALLAPERFS